MPYRVKLTERALRDMHLVYEFIAADIHESAFAWFNSLARAIYSLERLPKRGAVVQENKKLRQLFFGKKPGVYRIIYEVNERKLVVNILHIRHGARNVLSPG